MRRRCAFGVFIVVVIATVIFVTASSFRAEAYYTTMADMGAGAASCMEPIPAPVRHDIEETESEPVRTYYDSIPLSADLQTVVFEAAETYNVNPALILGIIEVESNFDTGAVSSSGCYGLMQLNGRFFGSNLSPADNIRTGTE